MSKSLHERICLKLVPAKRIYKLGSSAPDLPLGWNLEKVDSEMGFYKKNLFRCLLA